VREPQHLLLTRTMRPVHRRGGRHRLANFPKKAPRLMGAQKTDVCTPVLTQEVHMHTSNSSIVSADAACSGVLKAGDPPTVCRPSTSGGSSSAR